MSIIDPPKGALGGPTQASSHLAYSALVTSGDCWKPFERNPTTVAGQHSEFASGRWRFDAPPAMTSLHLVATHQGDRAPDRQKPAEAVVALTMTRPLCRGRQVTEANNPPAPCQRWPVASRNIHAHKPVMSTWRALCTSAPFCMTSSDLPAVRLVPFVVTAGRGTTAVHFIE